MNSFSSLLSFLIDHMLMLVFTSLMPISMRGMWSDGLQISGWSVCWPNPVLLGGRKTRSMTELVSRCYAARKFSVEM